MPSGSKNKPVLPTGALERKQLKLWDVMFNYFPKAWLAFADICRLGNKQHALIPTKLYWARGHSPDQLNAAMNHIFDYGTGVKKDADGTWHLAKAIWRLSAQLELDIEEEMKREELDRA